MGFFLFFFFTPYLQLPLSSAVRAEVEGSLPDSLQRLWGALRGAEPLVTVCRWYGGAHPQGDPELGWLSMLASFHLQPKEIKGSYCSWGALSASRRHWLAAIPGAVEVRVEAAWPLKQVRGLSGKEKASGRCLMGSLLGVRHVGMMMEAEPAQQLARNVVGPLSPTGMSSQQGCLRGWSTVLWDGGGFKLRRNSR